MTLQVFISYARKDGSEIAERLQSALTDRGIAAWRDSTNLDPTKDFGGEIDQAIEASTHVVVCVTSDVFRPDSFVRREIAAAQAAKKPIVPLMFPGGRLPVTIATLTYIPFDDFNKGFSELLLCLKYKGPESFTPLSRRDLELAYLQAIGQKYDHWHELYTDLAATALIEQPKVKLKLPAWKVMEMRYHIYQQIDHTLDADKAITVNTESLDELREGLRQYRRVALIGDPGAGKTTTLERLAYEYASAAVEESAEPYHQALPLFIRLGAYNGEDFTQFLETTFGSLQLRDYLPGRVILLLDGLNEMPPWHHRKVDDWLKKNPDVAVIVSCRKLDYIGLKLPLQRVDIAPLDLSRIRLFMSNFLESPDECEKLFWSLAGYDARRAWDWYRREKTEATYQDFFTAEDKPGTAWYPERKLLDVLRERYRVKRQLPDMLDVVTKPFLLEIVLEIYYLSGGEPPRNKGELFGRFVALLMEERGKIAARTDRAWINEAVQKQALAALAHRMQADPTGTSVSTDFVQETFRQAVPGTDADLLKYFAISAGILEQTRTVRFSHQLLQEYFAAYEMGEDLQRGVPATKYFPAEDRWEWIGPEEPLYFSVADWWMPTGWEETAFLLAGMQGDATSVVTWLTPVQPDLAYRVATESGAPCDSKALQTLYEPPTSARRSPYAVAEWGRLNHKQDLRPGIGLKSDSLPDIVWCDVRAGKFLYGDDKQEREILYNFKIAKYPVTYRQFQAFSDSSDFNKAEWWQGFPLSYQPQSMADQYNLYLNHPRDGVSWYQAVAFARWLDRQYRAEGLISDNVEIRLPLEQEWEYAARGPLGWIYPWGNDYRVGYANLDDHFQEGGPYFLNRTTAVGIYPQGESPFGVLDMAGQIWEWCLNKYNEPNEHLIDAGGESRVLRGGSWGSNRYLATCAFRLSSNPQSKNYNYGLRLIVGPLLRL